MRRSLWHLVGAHYSRACFTTGAPDIQRKQRRLQTNALTLRTTRTLREKPRKAGYLHVRRLQTTVTETHNLGVCMGLLDGVLGNASKIDPTKIQEEFQQILAPGERVEHAYQLIRDYFVFTDKRFVLVDKQGLTGCKVEYHSIPYKSITHFSIETAGTFDLDAELKIWISSTAAPIQKQFNKKLNIYEVQSVLASYVLK